MKHLTLVFVMTLSMLATAPALAQQSENVETDITVRIGGSDSAGSGSKVDSNSTEEFIEFMRGMMGDRVANEIAAEFEELDAEERAELEEKLSDSDFRAITINGDDWGGALIIPILAISLTLGMPIIIVLMVLYFSYRKRRQKAELISSFVEAGKDVPPQLLEETSTANNPLRSGLTLVFVAAAVSAAFFIIGEPEVAALALIPLALGLARLVFYFIDNKNNA